MGYGLKKRNYMYIHLKDLVFDFRFCIQENYFWDLNY